MEQYLIDNNVISDYFSEKLPPAGMEFVSIVIDQIPIISVITEIEALSWIHPDKNKERVIMAFIMDSNILPLTPIIVNECVKIRRSRKIKTPDAILAATAIVNKYTLLTRNINDFGKIPGLRMINPHDL